MSCSRTVPRNKYTYIMKTLRILVVDDTIANIEAAQIASKEFPQHEFVFMTSANEAYKQIDNFDAIITDLFFPEEPREMLDIYEKMQSVFTEDNESVKKLIEVENFLIKDVSLSERLSRNLSYVKNGSKHGFPLGLAIMAKAKGKRKCLISSIGGTHNNHGGVDGVIILLCLVDLGILPVSIYDGYYHYNGLSFVENFSDKTEPESWEKAILRVLAQ